MNPSHLTSHPANCLIRLLTGLGLAGACAVAPADTLPKQFENPSAVDVEIIGNVVEPESISPGPEQLDRLRLPDGFEVTVFAENLINPRMIAVADNGNVYVTRRSVGDVVMLRDSNGDGKADDREIVANRPDMHGIAIEGDTLYLVTVNELYRADLQSDGKVSELELLVDDLPDAGQHPNRTLAVGPDGQLYVSVGSTCNACSESSPESATMLRVTPDGAHRIIFATGLRNTIGFGFEPQSGELYGMDHGIDWLGDNLQHEELNHIVKGNQYGWPYIYGEGRQNPQDEPPGDVDMQTWASESTDPVGLYTPHAAPMQMAFYTGDQFPEDYRGDAFVAMRGSWNRRPPSGYEVTRIVFEEGKPVAFEPFITGFLIDQEDNNGSWAHAARLAGIAQAADGSLLLSDDANGILYRIAYTGAASDGTAGGEQAITNAEGANIGVSSTDSGAKAPETASGDLATEILELPEARLDLSSAAFEGNSGIPQKYAAEGQDISPPLAWEKGPEGTQSYVLIMEDPDVPMATPFVHWLIYNLPPDTTSLTQGVPGQPSLARPEGALQGRNDRGSLGYFGPRPPIGDPTHHYHFQLLALDKKLDLPYGASRAEILEAARGHVLAAGSLVGTFDR